MAIQVKRKEGESLSSFLFRFSKKVQQSGLLKEVKKRQFRFRPLNKRKKRLAALYRLAKEEELARLRRYGYDKD
jgi:ribosomal protein S21